MYQVLTSLYAVIQVYKLMLSDSGTLLLCCINRDGGLEKLRAALRKVFPGAPKQQTNTMHMSLLRILTPQQLTKDDTWWLEGELEKWTEPLKGRTFVVDQLWYGSVRGYWGPGWGSSGGSCVSSGESRSSICC